MSVFVLDLYSSLSLYNIYISLDDDRLSSLRYSLLYFFFLLILVFAIVFHYGWCRHCNMTFVKKEKKRKFSTTTKFNDDDDIGMNNMKRQRKKKLRMKRTSSSSTLNKFVETKKKSD